MKRSQLVGVMLWRGGLLLVAATGAVELVRALVQYYELPAQLEIGTALAGGGVLLVFLSVVLERRQDARTEGDLTG